MWKYEIRHFSLDGSERHLAVNYENEKFVEYLEFRNAKDATKMIKVYNENPDDCEKRGTILMCIGEGIHFVSAGNTI